jgi:hypothetical protein
MRAAAKLLGRLAQIHKRLSLASRQQLLITPVTHADAMRMPSEINVFQPRSGGKNVAHGASRGE